MQNKETKTDLANINFVAMKRPVQIALRDPRTKAYNTTIIYVDSNDPRSDYEVAKDYKDNLKLSKQILREKNKQLKLSKNPNGTVSRVFNWQYKDPRGQLKQDLEESLDAIKEYLPD